jgi:hypothetical protein
MTARCRVRREANTSASFGVHRCSVVRRNGDGLSGLALSDAQGRLPDIGVTKSGSFAARQTKPEVSLLK